MRFDRGYSPQDSAQEDLFLQVAAAFQDALTVAANQGLLDGDPRTHKGGGKAGADQSGAWAALAAALV